MLKKMVIMSSLGVVCASSSYAMIVFDPANFAKNAITAEQSIQTELNTAMTQANTLKTDIDTLKNYQQLVEQYNLTKANLEELANIKQYIANTQNTVNSNFGSSALSQLSSLNATSSNYIAQRDAILNKYFQKPLDPNYIQAEFQGSLNQDQIDAMKAQAQQQNLAYQRTQDAVDEAAHEQAAAINRNKNITDFGAAIQNLGPNSELKTQQMTATEVNFQLHQNEQMIQELNEQLKYIRLKQAQEDSEKAQALQDEQASFQRSLNQGTSGLGRDRWGDL
jgi:hypothetical protein